MQVAVGPDLAQGVDRIRFEGRREILGVARVRALLELRTRGLAFAALVKNRLGPRIDDQHLPRLFVGDVGVAQRMVGGVAVLALKLLELVPDRFLVRQVDGPLDIDQWAGAAGAPDRFALLELPALGVLAVVDKDLETRRLTLDPALRVFEDVGGLLLASLGLRLTGLRIGVDRQAAGGFRTDVIVGRAVADAGHSMPGWMR